VIHGHGKLAIIALPRIAKDFRAGLILEDLRARERFARVSPRFLAEIKTRAPLRREVGESRSVSASRESSNIEIFPDLDLIFELGSKALNHLARSSALV